MVPKEYGCWNTLFDYFNRWRKQGVCSEVMEPLRQQERQRQGRLAEPSAGCADSQSVKAATQGNSIGYEGVSGSKGENAMCLSILLSCYFVNGVKRLRKIWVDGNYSGSPLQNWGARLKKTHKLLLERVKKTGPGFNILKRRWVVERTFSWLFNYRRHSKDYERLTQNSEAMIQISMIHLLLKRLA